MKQKPFDKKLFVKKVTITNLSKEEQVKVHGGGTVWGRTCEYLLGTVWGRTCEIPS